MKHNHFFLILLCCLNTTLSAETQTISRRGTTNSEGSIPSFYVTSVSVADFRNTGETTLQKTFTISTPGYYVLVQDIGFQNGATAQNAIYINTSNVILDLGGRTLYPGSGAGTIMSGILLNNGSKNITIKNGNITGFTKYGIETGYSCRNLRIENISVGESVYSGLYFGGSGTSTDISELTIKNCTISHCSRTSGDATALYLNYCYNVTIADSIIGRTMTATSGTAKAVSINNSKNIVLANCDISSSESVNAAYGVYMTSTTHIICQDCNISGNFGGATYTGAGLYLNGCYDATFKNCSANSNSAATSGSGYGFAIDSTSFNISFIDCTASGNYSSGTGSGYGFSLISVHEGHFERCRANYNNGGNSGYGFYQTSSQKGIYKDCIAVGNTCTGSSSNEPREGGHGFVSISGLANLYDTCFASGNVTGASATNSLSSGFFADNEKETTWINCESRSNGGDSIAPNAGGFYLDDTNGSCVRCIVNGCTAAGNRSSATAYGFYDKAAANTTLFVDCFGFGNKTANYYLANGSGSSYISVNAPVTNQTTNILVARNPFENVSINPA
jgi:hypothetical protein